MSSTRCLIFNPPVPVTTEILGGVCEGRYIFVSGVPKVNNKRFTINLQQTKDPGSDIGFHFDVRFNYGGIKGVVRNYRIHNGWFGEETKIPHFPFKENENFLLVICCKHDKYQISVNNEHFIEYGYKISPEKVHYLNITGDITLTEINYQCRNI